MLFNSGEFIIFFPLVVIIYYIIPKRVKNIWLLIASYYFYMCWNAKYVILLAASTLITYSGGIAVEKIKFSEFSEKKQNTLKKTVLAAAVILNLLILFYFKYFGFTLELLEQVFSFFHISLSIPAVDIILPVGISFYIFQALGYLIDVYRDDIYAEKNILRYALFVSFFPQLVAGPIERSKNLLKQLSIHHKYDPDNLKEGLQIMLWGFFLKLVIADRCAILVDTVYASYTEYQGFQLIVANILFAIQIYCDFMGYSTIAKGAAKVLGIDLMDNFRQPFFAGSIRELWKRWHISLSTWFRDYVFIPMGGSKCSRLKKYRNIFITCLISGLWHGANLTYVLWGAIHGVYQILEECLKPVSDKLIRSFRIRTNVFSWRFFMILKTVILFDVALIFFRARTVSSAWQILTASFRLENTGLLLNDGLYQLGLNTWNMNILTAAVLILFVVSIIKEKKGTALQWLNRQNIAFRFVLYWGLIILIILSLDISGKEFIYFQF